MRFIILLALFASCIATTAFIDMWEVVKDAKCMVAEYKQIALRVYQSVGRVDPNFNKSVVALAPYRANLTLLAYIVPCIKCDVAKQVKEIAAAMTAAKIKDAALQITATGWNTDHAKNVEFVRNFTTEWTKNSLKLSFMTDDRTWDTVMGRDCQEFGSYRLWIVRHDHNPENNRMRPFGGWRKASFKQYDTAEVCGNAVSKDSKY